jgi:hypothetical protein
MRLIRSPTWAHLSPEEFKLRVTQITHLPAQEELKQEFKKGSLRRCPLLPITVSAATKGNSQSANNLHHIAFESDFSSVNGWFDPITNLIFRPLVRRIKAKSYATQV